MKKSRLTVLAITVALVIMPVMIQTASANPGSRIDALYALFALNWEPLEGAYSNIGSEAPRLEGTHAAAVVFDDWGTFDTRPPGAEIVRMKNFTRKVQWRSGGEESWRYGGFGPFIAGGPTAKTAFLAAETWEIYTQQSNIPNIEDVEINATAACIYINSTQSVNGGFVRNTDPDSSINENDTDIVSTFYALYTLDSMITAAAELEEDPPFTSIDDILLNRTKTEVYITSCQDGNAFKLTPDSLVAGVTPTAAAIMALDILGRQVDVSIVNWLVDRQVSEADGLDDFGGFSEGILTNDTNLVSTYWALRALHVSGAIDAVNASSAAQFILDCQAEDGSWGIVPGVEVGLFDYAAMAVRSLRFLGDEYSARLHEQFPHEAGVPLIDWRLLFIIVFLVAALIIALIALRMD
jgi:prenyltransferase beta subunit